MGPVRLNSRGQAAARALLVAVVLGDSVVASVLDAHRAALVIAAELLHVEGGPMEMNACNKIA